MTSTSSDAQVGDSESTESNDLKGAAVSGVRWTTLSKLLAQVGTLASSIVLARLLSPAEFGEAAIAMILLPLSVLLSFAGFGAALVQYREIDQDLVRSAGAMSVLFGAAQTVAVYLLAPVIAEPLFGDATSDLIQLISPIFFLAGLAVVPKALLQRELRFQRLSIIELLGLVCGTAVSLVAAISGVGASSLVWGALATAAISRLLMVSSVPFSRPAWNGPRNLEIVRFGLPASLTSLAFWARQNADYAVIGATLGSTATGLYWRAYQWGAGYQYQISGTMAQVAFPVLSRSTDRDHLLRIRARITRATNVMLLPILGLIIASAPVLIPWLFGSQWTGAVVPTQLLAVAGVASCATAPVIPVMLAAGHPRPAMLTQVGALLALIAMCLAAVPWGLNAVSGAVALLQVLVLFAVYRWLLRGVLGLPSSIMREDLLPAVLPAAVLLAVTFPMVEGLRDLDLAAFPLLAAVSIVGAAVYTLVLHRFFPDAFHDVRTFVLDVLPVDVGRLARLSVVRAAIRILRRITGERASAPQS